MNQVFLLKKMLQVCSIIEAESDLAGAPTTHTDDGSSAVFSVGTDLNS